MRCIMLTPDARMGRDWRCAIENLGEDWQCIPVVHGQQALECLESYAEVLLLTACGESRELLRSAFMNAVLFFPAGLLLGGLLPGHRSFRWQLVCAVICFGLISLGIELTQFFNRLGNAEFDDVLHNTLGAAAGLAAFHVKWSD